jgi:predicted nucleic acid-binding protein
VTSWLVDTSVAVPALVADHEHHRTCAEFVRTERPALGGHALVETYSVLTRLPFGLRLRPEQAVEVIGRAFPDQPQPSLEALRAFLRTVASMRLSGGSIYDALVALAARDNERGLATRDERAAPTYRAMSVSVLLVD